MYSKINTSLIQYNGKNILFAGVQIVSDNIFFFVYIKLLDGFVVDFEDRKPVTSIIGNLTDPDVVRKACKNVKCVFHIAALVEYKLFPDITALNEINIQGMYSRY